ncbi:hypothetical protein KAR91_03440 [Candidatus Pacearchaeota archaeon]|nr:hypothetical protein [Candidatus Pacearchaeota archaeon]
MSKAGTQPEFVNAQLLSLTNVTDGERYDQIQNLALDLKRATYFKSLQDGNIDRLYGAADNALEFDLVLTVPEVITFVNLTKMTDLGSNRTLPEKIWRISGVAKNGTTFRIDFSGAVVVFRTNKPILGAVSHHVRVEATSITVTET